MTLSPSDTHTPLEPSAAAGGARLPIRSLGALIGSAVPALRARWQLREAQLGGARIRVWGKVVVQRVGAIAIDDRTQFVGTIVPIYLATGPSGRIEIGAGVYMNYGCSIGAMELVRIGARCSFGPYVMIMDNAFHQLEPERRNEIPPSGPVTIGEDVWLGARVIVLPGVTIGAGAAVGAGSVVTRDVPPRSLAVGSPARVIRTF
jgi:acetyltransferase-like isoleucine patch superfamily enzyme